MVGDREAVASFCRIPRAIFASTIVNSALVPPPPYLFINSACRYDERTE
jgi:hypothetical protein